MLRFPLDMTRTQQAGIGMTALQLPFDLRFVWKGAKLTFPFVRRGIMPECNYRTPACLYNILNVSLL